MNVLFYAFPQVLPQGPQFNSAWSTLLAGVMRGLLAEGRDSCLLVTGRRFEPFVTALAEGLPVAYVDELRLLREVREADSAAALPTEFSRQARSPSAAAFPAVRVLAAHVGEAAGRFEPDVVITFSMRAEYLKSLWPRTEIFYVEAGAFSRFPYPFTLFFDHLGMYAEAGPSRLDPSALGFGGESMGLPADLRDFARARFRRTDPFAAHDFRTRFERLALFPLQVSNYYSFDEQSPYRTQFEYVVDVLAQAPPEVGVIVSEYIQWGEVFHTEGSAANLDWLRRAFPNLLFHETFRRYASPSQYLLDHADGTYAIASNLGYQALLFGKRLGCGPASYLANVAHDRDPATFFRAIERGEPGENRDAFLAWYLERYLVPEPLYSDGAWFSAYLDARIRAIHAGLPPAEAFTPVADPATLRRIWLQGHESPRPATYQTSTSRLVHERALADLAGAAVPILPVRSALGAPDAAGARDAYVLLNDTRRIDDGLHMGCNAVTAFLEAWMSMAGLRCVGRINVAEEGRELLSSPDLDRVRVVVLNGEGSAHHDSARIHDLMVLCRELRAKGIPSVLINSVWHENGERLGSLLRHFELVSVRESISHEAIRPWRPDARLVPDLSLAAFRVADLLPQAPEPGPRRVPWCVIDHVDAAVAAKLHGFARVHALPFHLMGRLHVDAFIRDPIATYQAEGRASPSVLRNPAELLNADACLTGRFHGLTAALCAEVPVLALGSNTPKVQGLLLDAGIGGEAFLDPSWLSLGIYRQIDELNGRLAMQGEATRRSVQRYLQRALAEIESLMRDVVQAGRN